MSSLSGLKVLDFSMLLPGPYATMILGDLGADVLRIESPAKPDLMRFYPPIKDGESETFHYLNRNKRSLSLNLKSEEGKAIVHRLVSEYDVVIEQFRPGVMEKLGLGYEDLKTHNPGLIYCSISGYGQTGPYRLRAGHDVNYLSIAGITSYNGRKSSGPAPMNLQIADIAGGSHHAVMTILAAVIHRLQTGEGQYLDVSLTDTAFSMQVTGFAAALDGTSPAMEEEIFNGGTFYDCYETRDHRHFSVASIEPHFFERLCQAMGFPELACHALTPDPEIQAQIRLRIADTMKTKDFAEWQEIFAGIDACVEPVLSLTEALTHPQILARELMVDVPHGNGVQRQAGFPVKFSATRPEYRFTAVPAGQHTREVLGEAGYSEEEIRHFEEQGALR